MLEFTKYHGLGNDFIIVDGRNRETINWPAISRMLCKRRYGVGADGLILLKDLVGEKRIPQMQLFNADGSEAEMCGNGLRCFIHYLFDVGLFPYQKEWPVITKFGQLKATITAKNGLDIYIRVDMAKPVFMPEEIPVDYRGEKVLNVPIKINNKSYAVNSVSTGPPHTVVFFKSPAEYDPLILGPLIENHPMFPAKTNVNFAVIKSTDEVDVQVWERGVGLTEACGTGACAVSAIGQVLGLLSKDVKVNLPGGTLTIQWIGEGHSIFMTGPSRYVYRGSITI